ncbi:ABC transporter substrate-binding protein [Arthrobacter sp. FW306-2-2C-D06B]|uniref:ABC transporter substrate-binding protein n=1 Tax=Arthrobacter sp. FW306-2-2C-D06B TaxID=2879618 RepID=UPI001F324BAF|nr:ABC transporter substrate-binding protein [Arthrobacter sp. FW306-2-2C-D06B]UKA58776.1 ABC transporter substrate-binding protein [Arthrobacter sp. FW306-2-2C-D06B]
MSHPIDVGSVLGGRYKVTATVLTSHDQDLVLDGVDQVLNRPVSILVAGPGNAEQVAKSAREVATGERPGHVQILDLGVSDSTTYLITNHSSAPDLLDLVVATNPPYVEPFFTDTLGSEIFGQARSHEPETYDGLYDEEEHDAEYISYDEVEPHPAGDSRPGAAAPADPRRPVVPPMPAARPTSAPGGIGSRIAAAAAGAGAAAAAAAAAVKGAGKSTSGDGEAAPSGRAGSASAAESATSNRTAESNRTAPQQIQAAPATQAVPASTPPAPTSATPSQESKVSLWSEDDYGFVNEDGGARGAGATRDAAAATGGYSRGASSFPSTAREQAEPLDEDEYYDEEPVREPRSFRWLVGGVLAAVLIVGLILAVTNLGNLIPGGTPAAKQSPTASQTVTGQPSSSTSAPPVAAPPVIDGVSRMGDFEFAATYDKDLVKAYDGNAASYWSDMEFATADWGGLAPDGVSLLVKLKAPSQVTSVTLSQLGASGGNINVYTNDRPAMDGAKLVGTNSFTSPELTMPLSSPVTAQYVIISIKSLPKLTAPKTRYGFGLRLAEIKVQ